MRVESVTVKSCLYSSASKKAAAPITQSPQPANGEDVAMQDQILINRMKFFEKKQAKNKPKDKPRLVHFTSIELILFLSSPGLVPHGNVTTVHCCFNHLMLFSLELYRDEIYSGWHCDNSVLKHS